MPTTDSPALHGFVRERAAHGAIVYTDDAAAYASLPDMFNGYQHGTVRHSVGEYVRGMAHTNGIESFWSMLKRAHKDTFHKLSEKHLGCYVGEFAGRHNDRAADTADQMRATAGKRLPYRVLTA